MENLVLAIFQLHKVRRQYWYVLSNYLQDTLGVTDMLEDNLCLHQTILQVLSQKELTMLQNKYR